MANGIFNAEQYLELYPALVEAGITVDTAWDHYATYGAGELRAPNAELDGKVYAASVLDYANANEDVAEYFGIEVPAESLTQEQAGNVMLQYVLFGYDEDRDAKIIDAPVERDDSDTVAAINDYQDAKAAETAAIKEAAKELDTEETKAAVDGEVKAAAADLTGTEAYQIEGFNNKEFTAGVRDQLLKAKEDTLKAELAAQENVQGKALGAAKALANAEARLAAAKSDSDKAKLALESKEDAFKVYASHEDSEFTFNVVEGTPTFASKDDSSVVVTLVYKDGKTFLGDASGKALVSDEDKALAKQVEKTEGYSDYFNAFAAANKADDKSKAAIESVEAAVAKYNDNVADNDKLKADSEGVVTPEGSASKYTAYQEAAKNLNEFDKLAKDYKAAAAQLANIEAAEDNVADAVKVLKDMGYDVVLDEFATEGDDLFIYSEDANIEYYFDFGAEGEDAFFFGTQFSFVELAAGDDIAKGGFGDKNAFEVFAQQDGNDVVLYVETNEVGGTATGTEDLDTITLVGVDLADLQWDGGFLTVA